MNRAERRRRARLGEIAPEIKLTGDRQEDLATLTGVAIDRIGIDATDKTLAAIDMLHRTGSAGLQIRFSDDEQPTVWFAVVHHRLKDGVPQPAGPINAWEAAAGHDATEALLRLCEKVVDGGHCAHCGRPSMFYADIDDSPLPGIDELLCAYEWDPELKTYRRSCEGD